MPNLQELKERFESLYAEWEEIIKDPHIQISSRPQDYIDNEPYRKMVSLGKDALPFVLEKIDAGVFLMNQAVLEITKISMDNILEKEKKLLPSKRLDFAEREMPQFPSEQQKSRLILKHVKSPNK